VTAGRVHVEVHAYSLAKVRVKEKAKVTTKAKVSKARVKAKGKAKVSKASKALKEKARVKAKEKAKVKARVKAKARESLSSRRRGSSNCFGTGEQWRDTGVSSFGSRFARWMGVPGYYALHNITLPRASFLTSRVFLDDRKDRGSGGVLS
jgi:hypothetical protein